MEKNYLDYMESKPSEMDEMINENPIAIIPFGALEWHSKHNVLGLDSLKATEICKRTIQKTGGVLFPCVNYGAFSTMKFPYTFHSSKRPYKRMTRKIAKQLYGMGFKIIVIVTGHYPKGQIVQVKKAAQGISKKYKDCFAIGIPESALVTDLGYLGDHAAEWETSTMMAINPDYVELERIPSNLNYPERAITLGIMGKDPTKYASKEKGEMILNEIVNRLSQAIFEVKKSKSIEPFEEIYNKHKAALKEVFRNLEKALKIHGIGNKREGLAFGYWWIFKRKKYNPDYKYKKK